MSHAPIRRKRRWLAPVVVVSVLLLLLLAAFAVAEKLVRDAAADLVRGPIQQVLATDNEVAIGFGPGSVILQALGGGIDQVRVSARDVAFGPTGGDLEIQAYGVPLSPAGSIKTLGATLHVDEAGLQPLIPAIGSTAPAAAFADGQLVLTAEVEIAGQPRPVEVWMAPEVASGRMTLVVTGLAVDGAQASVEDARAGAYGPAAAAFAASPSVCVAEHLPASFALDSVEVHGNGLLLAFSGSNVALAGGGLATRGSCPEEG